MYTRDLPREDAPKDWRAGAWNQDAAWVHPREIAGLVPALEPGASREVPADLVRRIARCHLVDNVFGQTLAYRDDEIREAALTATVEKVEGGRAWIRFEGRVRAEAEGRWAMRGLRREVKDMTRGYDARLRGWGVFVPGEGRFAELSMVAVGDRWGGTQYNVRDDDLGPAPMGVAFVLAADDAPRIAPAHLHSYGW